MRLQIPVKHIWRDSEKRAIDSVSTFIRYLSQPFGTNWAPIPYPTLTGDLGHPGIDIPLPVGERVYSAHDGLVIEVDSLNDNDGLGVVIQDLNKEYFDIYWHTSFNHVQTGAKIKKGQLIALSGATGKSYGPHLHYALYPLSEDGSLLYPKNGYHGAVDPTPFFEVEVFAPTIMERDFVSNFYLFYFGEFPSLKVLDFWEGKNYRDLFKAALGERAKHYEENKR